MEDALREFAGLVSLGCVALCLLAIGAGAAEAAVRSALAFARPEHGLRRAAWVRFGVWLMLGLEFALAADIAETAIAPSWDDIGQLAAIAAIRTALNLFLKRDLEEARAAPPERSAHV